MIILELAEEDDERSCKRGKTRKWIRRRKDKGYFENIVRELSIEDTAAYKEMMRMSHEEFLYVLCSIEKDSTSNQVLGGNEVIYPKARLTVTIRLLASGETYRSLSFQFRMSMGAICYIVKEVCNANIKDLSPVFFKVPSSEEEWLEISAKFEERWQFPNCIGVLDGKHIVMQPPSELGSRYFNYKHTHSIVLLGVDGPDYECLCADIGTNGRVSDGGVWSKCSLANNLANGNALNLPPPKCLSFGMQKVPYGLAGDDAFTLKPYFMKPYPQSGLTEDRRIYNCHHSRARRISENLFGIIANCWRVFRSVILLPPKTIEIMLMATLTVHNFLRKSPSRNIYCQASPADSENRSGELNLGT